MKVSLQRSPINRVATDLLCVFVHQDPPLFKKEISALTKTLGAKISAAMNGDFRGKDGETAMAY
ncbi:MAG: hypothetical protein WEB62_09880, partial [Bacteroidota bacterium]